MRDIRPGSAQREAVDLEQRLRETDRRGDAAQSAASDVWRPSTESGGYHGWTGSVSMNSRNSFNEGTFVVAPYMPPDSGGVGKFARMDSAGLVLNQAGVWSLTFTGSGGGDSPGSSWIRLSWAGGPWQRTYGPHRDNWLTRRADVASGGNLVQDINYFGYVNPEQATKPIIPSAAQKQQSSAPVVMTFFLVAELVAVYDPIISPLPA